MLTYPQSLHINYQNFCCRFQFLEEFLRYLRQWKDSTENRAGNFTHNARANMFLSWQTFEGFNITVHSAIEVVRFLLEEGMEFVLTERFCQDPVEEYFGKQHQLGRRSDNPDIHQFGYNSNTIRIERSISCSNRAFILPTRGQLTRQATLKNLYKKTSFSLKIWNLTLIVSKTSWAFVTSWNPC